MGAMKELAIELEEKGTRYFPAEELKMLRSDYIKAAGQCIAAWFLEHKTTYDNGDDLTYLYAPEDTEDIILEALVDELGVDDGVYDEIVRIASLEIEIECTHETASDAAAADYEAELEEIFNRGEMG